MKHINTLVSDIQDLVKRKDGWFSEQLSREFAADVAQRLSTQLGETKGPPSLRLSQMGPRCPCALWHSIHAPDEAEPLPPWAEIKFSLGHIVEALAITLAKAAGHHVVGEQDELIVDGVKGHRDCVIDGCIVDVKSAASLSFKKFKDGTIGQDDSFGYLDQLDAYLVGSIDDPIVTVKDRAYLFAVDKQLGHMCLYEHRLRENSIRERIKYYKQIVERPTPPACECGTVGNGEAGNIELDLRASYSPQKHSCFPHLRTFVYSGGPKYFTKVVKPPKYKGIPLQEVNRHGKIIYS